MPSEPIVTTIQASHLHQQGLTVKDLEDYLNKKVPGSFKAEMRHNTYHITAWYAVNIVDIKKYTEKVKTDQAAANTVTNEDNIAGDP